LDEGWNQYKLNKGDPTKLTEIMAQASAAAFPALLIFAGIVGALYFSFLFDVTSHDAGVVNLGRLNERLIGFQGSLAVVFAGILPRRKHGGEAPAPVTSATQSCRGPICVSRARMRAPGHYGFPIPRERQERPSRASQQGKRKARRDWNGSDIADGRPARGNGTLG
jgi:hypothetical protein